MPITALALELMGVTQHVGDNVIKQIRSPVMMHVYVNHCHLSACLRKRDKNKKVQHYINLVRPAMQKHMLIKPSIPNTTLANNNSPSCLIT